MKKSIMLYDDTAQIIRNSGAGEPKWSRVINDKIRALEWIVKNSLPDLNPEEWQTIYDTYPDGYATTRIPYSVAADVMRAANALTPEETDNPELIIYLSTLRQSEQYALLERINKQLDNPPK